MERINMLNYLTSENIKALKEKNELSRSVLSGVIANIKRAAIDQGCRDNITNGLVTEVLRKEEKTLNEMITTCPTDRPELREQYEAKLEVLRKYVPELITDPDKIRHLITNTCIDIELTTSNKGKIMKTMSTEYKGQVDMKVVQKVVSELIEEKSNG
jgi:uncharacterized protein YqeY